MKRHPVRAVITGIGVVTIAGEGVDPLWDLVCDPAASPGDGIATGFDPADHLPRRAYRRMDRVTQLAAVATELAVADAGGLGLDDPARGSVQMGTTYAGLASLKEGFALAAAEGDRAVSPVWGTLVPSYAVASEVAARAGCSGSAFAVGAACATGSVVLSNAVAEIRSGRSDVVLAGGAEAAQLGEMLTSFQRMGVMAADRPRPFDVARDGFWPSEGAAVIVVESYEHAVARGARIRAELRGGAVRTDIAGGFAPSDEEAVLEACIRGALADAAVPPEEVGHVNAHGTGTIRNDVSEAAAIERVVGTGVPVTSVKGALGHGGSVAGTFEAIASVLAIERGLIPPIVGLTDPAPEIAVDLVRDAPRPWTPGPVLSTSLGLGGHMAAVVVAPADDDGDGA